MKIRVLIYSAVLLVGIVSVFAFATTDQNKIAFIDILELYDGFDMKKELEQSFNSVQNGRKQQLDSLELEVRLLNAQIEEMPAKRTLIETFEIKRDHYLQKKRQFDEDNVRVQGQYSSNIRKQLNQYVADYAKEKGYDYLLGADGSGAIMYANENADVTKEVLIYINNKYKGLK